jgi:DNA-directed RNA polymerase subunit RPC12/RpoP
VSQPAAKADEEACPACGGGTLRPMRVPVMRKGQAGELRTVDYRMIRQCANCGRKAEPAGQQRMQDA